MRRLKSVLQRLPSPLLPPVRWILRLRQSRARLESNAWLRKQAQSISGQVLSIGSASDSDGEGDKYRDYFLNCDTYLTSEIVKDSQCDLVLDVRSMPEIESASFDAIFCSGVLEHVDDLPAAINEIARILKSGGILLLGVPFRQPLHLVPHDYWRFTEYGIRWLLRNTFEVLKVKEIDLSMPAFPATYWVRARRR